MQLSNIPAKFVAAFANAAGGSYIRTIPVNPSGTPGQASLATGFPPENFSPVAAGGVPPYGQDFNGLLNQSTAWNVWQATGAVFPPYDPTFQTAIGGYPMSSIVQSLVSAGTLYWSLVDNNVTNPDTGGAGWMIWYRRLITNTDIYVNGSTGNDSNNGLTLATAVRTIGAATLIAWSFPPSQYTVTIHIATGITYNESVQGPSYAGPNLIIDGGVAATTLIIAPVNTTAFGFGGPNTVKIQNLTFQTSGSASTANGISASTGALVTSLNTASNSLGGSVFLGNNGGYIFPGNHTYNGGSCQNVFQAVVDSIVKPGGTHTFAAALAVAGATAVTTQCGQIDMGFTAGQITFVNGGNVTGQRYNASLNGVIVATGIGGPSSIPGSSAGATATGGQAV